jgi:hypothetical protein
MEMYLKRKVYLFGISQITNTFKINILTIFIFIFISMSICTLA